MPPKPPPEFPEVQFNFVWSAPAPRRTTLLLVILKAATEKFPAGMRTTLFAGADEIALVIVEAETEPPERVLHADVVQFDQFALGMSPTTPAVDQSAARVGSMIPRASGGLDLRHIHSLVYAIRQPQPRHGSTLHCPISLHESPLAISFSCTAIGPSVMPR